MANEDALASDPGPIRAFIGALARGTTDLGKDPEAGIRALLEANRDLDPELQREVVEVTLPLFEAPAGEPYGWQEPEQWTAFGDFLAEAGIVEEPVAAETFTNEYLPGEGP